MKSPRLNDRTEGLPGTSAARVNSRWGSSANPLVTDTMTCLFV